MTPQPETLETVGHGIDEVRAKIVATRESLQSVLDRGIDVPVFRQSVERLERIEAELMRIEGGIMAREGLA